MIWIVILLIFGSFSFVVLFGAPYVPTLKNRYKIALDLLDLKSGQLLLEPGCGDGRVLLMAAKQGIKGVGYELNPLLVIVAKAITWRHRKLIQIRWANFWQEDWPKADGIYVFILQRYMPKLDKKIIQSKCKKVVSYAYQFPDKKPDKQKSAMFLYLYQ